MTLARFFATLSPVVFTLTVIVLGFVTPGYDHLNHTMSRLAIEKYGWIQSLNFIQLAWGISITGTRVTDILRKQKSEDNVIRIIFRICSIFLVIAAFVPTDPIENVPLDYTLLTPTGLVHISVVVIFLMLSPFGIARLAEVLSKEPRLKHLAPVTLGTGYAALMGSIIWFVFYFAGIFLEYRGIFQKAIALPVLLWFVMMNHTIFKKNTV